MSITNNFLRLNYNLVLRLKEEFNVKAEIEIKNGYVRFRLQQSLYRFIIYATNEKVNFEIISRFFDKLYSPKEECGFVTTYITAKETENWSETDKDKYIEKTIEYVTTLIDYSKNMQMVFETYSWDYDFESMILDFVRKNEEKTEPLISEYIATHYGGSYCLNGFFLYITKYCATDKLNEHIDFLKKIIELSPSTIRYIEGRTIEDYFEKYYVGGDTYGIIKKVIEMSVNGESINQIHEEINEEYHYDLTTFAINKIIAENKLVEGVIMRIKDDILVKCVDDDTAENVNIVVPDGIKAIGEYAFAHYTNLKEIHLPDSIMAIENNAFLNCENLEEIHLPDSITRIGRMAFIDCYNLKEVSFPNSITEIRDNTFSGCANLKKVTIPNSVIKIGKGAFSYCKSLEEINLSNAVTEIGKGAFYNCASLKKIVIPNSVTKIGESVFSSCESLKEINIPNTITRINAGTFYNCKSLEKVTILDGITEIGDYAFSKCESLKEINIPNTVKKIGEGVFCYCKNLEEISLSNKLMKMEKFVFGNCKSLKKIAIPEGITKINKSTFYNCKSLEKFNIPNSVTVIDNFAFAGCESLKRLDIPKNVKRIGKSIFRHCKNLKEITMFENLSKTKIDNDLTYDCENFKVIRIISNS